MSNDYAIQLHHLIDIKFQRESLFEIKYESFQSNCPLEPSSKIDVIYCLESSSFKLPIRPLDCKPIFPCIVRCSVAISIVLDGVGVFDSFVAHIFVIDGGDSGDSGVFSCVFECVYLPLYYYCFCLKSAVENSQFVK